MKKFIILLMFCGILESQQSDEEALPIPNEYKPTGLLIFLDDSENKIEAISSDFIVALDQKVGPIIVSGHIVRNIFSNYVDIKNLESNSKTILEREYWKLYSDKDNQNKIKNYYLKAINFQEDKWIIKKINDDLYLFIFKESESTQKIGLDVESIDDISIDTLLKVKKSEQKNYFKKSLSKIFKTDSKCFWTIWMSGHGLVGTEICGMDIPIFKGVLSFLNDNIKTRLFIYTSCFSGGISGKIAFSPTEKYNFAIINQSNTDAPTSTSEISIQNDFILKSNRNYKDFFEKIYLSKYTYKEIAEKLFKIIPVSTPVYLNWGNLPLIRLPNDGEFKVLANLGKSKENHKIVVINEKSTNPFKFDNDIYQAILLYVEKIPEALMINSSSMQAIISMIPGDAFHAINAIDCEKNNLIDILKWFVCVDELSAKKTFYISKIKAKDQTIADVIVYLDVIKAIGLAKITGSSDEFVCKIYYKDVNKDVMFLNCKVPGHTNLRIKLSEQVAINIPNDEKQSYDSLLAKATGKIDTIEEISFASFKDMTDFFVEKNKNNFKYTSSIINFIKCPVEIYLMLNSFWNIIEKESFLWIKSVTGKYVESSYYNTSGIASHIGNDNTTINNDSEITITNVLMDKKTNSICYTFNNKFYNSRNSEGKITAENEKNYKDFIEKYGTNNAIKSVEADYSIVALVTSLAVLA